MGHKIFISYKYADDTVQPLSKTYFGGLSSRTTVRDYVDRMESFFDNSTHIYKGESDNEDLSGYSEDSIWELLKDRIFDSSVTIVMVSPNMRERNRSDRSQWIPWEISFSLKEKTRNDRTSHANAVLAVVLPDRSGQYGYYLQWLQNNHLWGSIYSVNGGMFSILKNNMGNRKQTWACRNRECHNERSYIMSVRWDKFIDFPDHYIEKAIAIKEDADCYEIKKEV
jgi:hypothetical protein